MKHLEVGLLDSLAWRGDGQVHLALHLPDAGLAPGAEGVMLQLRDDDRRVRRAAAVRPAATGVLVEASVPGPRLADGLWRIALRPGAEAELVRLEARLLVKPGQPVALIPGPAPQTRMTEPSPRSAVTTQSGGARRLARRLTAAMGRRLGR